MIIDKTSAIKAAGKLGAHASESSGFKAVMDQKRAHSDKFNKAQTLQEAPTLKTMVNDVVKNHEVAAQTVKTFMARTDYSPERLLAIQYRSGMLFLREQMYCKTAELSANTFKNFTQMQI